MNENSEKELLKQDLNNQENPEEIKKFIEDVEVMGENEDIVEMAKQKLEAILAKANTVEKTSESQISQVESMGGSIGEIEKRTEGIDKQVEEVKTQAQEKIAEVQNENTEEVKKETAIVSEESIASVETVGGDQKEKKENKEKANEKIEKFNEEMKDLLDQVVGRMPEKIKEYYNSAEYNKLLELNNKKNAEEKSLFEVYDRITKGNDDHRRGFAIGRGSAHYYLDDLKFANASADIIKRFEEFDDKIAKPTFDAEWPAELKMKETIDDWTFKKSLISKLDENFKDDPKGRKEAYSKWSEEYDSNFNKIKTEVAPNKPSNINTYGTIFS